MIVTIARQCGCDGDELGEKLAKKLDIPFYDRRRLTELAIEKGIIDKHPNFFAENPVNSLLYAIASGENNIKLTDVPKQIYDTLIGDGDGVIVGRCGNFAYKDAKNAVRIFLSGDLEKRIDRICEEHGYSNRKQGENLVKEYDDRRASFHKFNTGQAWGSARYYDLCIDVTRLGEEKSIELILNYIKMVEEQ